MCIIRDFIKRIVQKELRLMRVAELAVVTATYPNSSNGDEDQYACDVQVKDSGLVLKKVPIATQRLGTVALPNLGDLVLLAFEKGDVNQPVVIGRLYNEENRPPPNRPNEVIFCLPLTEDDDKTIVAAIRNTEADTPSRELLIEMPPKIAVHISDSTVRVMVGRTEMALDQSGGSGGKVTVAAGRSKITMDQDGDVTVEAVEALTLKSTCDLTLEAQNVMIKSMRDTNIEAGTHATLTASLGAVVNGGLSSTLQGTNVSIKGLTSFSPL